jgi:hypothetical protein
MKDISDLKKTFSTIASELGRQYGLGYYPTHSVTDSAEQVRRIEVKVRQPNLIVRARENYAAEEAKTK